MKRAIRNVVFLISLIMIFVSALVYAETGVEESGENKNWKYTARLENDSITTGESYIIIAIYGDHSELPATLNADDILYLNQVSATENGVVVFNGTGDGFKPKTYEGGSVFVSGGNLSSPIKIGNLPFHGLEYYGTIKSYGTGAPTISLINAENVATVGTVSKISESNLVYGISTHSFEFNSLPRGTYTLKIEKPQHGTWQETITINTSESEVAKQIYRLGDVTKDGRINTTDISYIIDKILTRRTFDNYTVILGDVNRSKTINTTDVGRVIDRILSRISEF